MPERIAAVAYPLSRVFSEDFRFTLPYFQRGYAWQVEHTDSLLHDLLTHAEGQGDIDWYPLGSIIVSKTGAPDAQVADGHQRLITLTILIAILRDLEQDRELAQRLAACIVDTARQPEVDAYRVVTLEQASETLRDYVQVQGSTSRLLPDDVELAESEENILTNRDHLRMRLAGLRASTRQNLARFLLDDCMLTIMLLADEKAAALMFATMHDRGLRPSSSDLFKARILSCIDPAERSASQTIWESREAALGEETFASLFRHLAFLADGPLQRRTAIEVLNNRYQLADPAKARIFVETDLQTHGRLLELVRSAPLKTGVLPGPISRRLQFLSWIRTHDTWTAPLLAWLERYGFDNPQTPEFLRRLEALGWTETIVAEAPPRREARYNQLVGAILRGSVFASGSPLDVTRAERNEMRKALAAPNFTKRRYRLFLLLRLNAAVDGNNDIVQLPDATIEHVYPRNPAARSQWQADFRAGAASNRLRDEIGNLTLLTETEQIGTQNYDFAKKKGVLASSAFALSRQIGARTTWRADDIRANTRASIDLLMKSWGLD